MTCQQSICLPLHKIHIGVGVDYLIQYGHFVAASGGVTIHYTENNMWGLAGWPAEQSPSQRRENKHISQVTAMGLKKKDSLPWMGNGDLAPSLPYFSPIHFGKWNLPPLLADNADCSAQFWTFLSFVVVFCFLQNHNVDYNFSIFCSTFSVHSTEPGRGHAWKYFFTKSFPPNSPISRSHHPPLYTKSQRRRSWSCIGGGGGQGWSRPPPPPMKILGGKHLISPPPPQ